VLDKEKSGDANGELRVSGHCHVMVRMSDAWISNQLLKIKISKTKNNVSFEKRKHADDDDDGEKMIIPPPSTRITYQQLAR
jgi:hypothetical protein